MAKPRLGLFSGLALALLCFVGALLAGAGAGFLAGKTPGRLEAGAALALGLVLVVLSGLGALRLLRGAPRSWKVGALLYFVATLIASCGPGIELLRRSDLGRCPDGFFACIWPDTKEALRDLKDDL